MLTKKQLALVHLAKNQIGMEDKAYRALLENTAGVSSSKDLTETQFDDLMNEFIKKGFKPKGSPWKGKRYKQTSDKQPMLRKIGAILNELGYSWAYADGIAKKMFKKDKVFWCSADQIYKITQALSYHQQRKRNKRGAVS